MSMATLGTLAEMAAGQIDAANAAVAIAGVGTDTRTPLHGQLFVALRGPRFDGHDHLGAAMEAGAAAVVVEGGAEVPQGLPPIRVDDTQLALGRMGAAWRRSLQSIKVVAITGTAGKTTTKDLLAAVCGAAVPSVASPRSFNNAIGVPLTILAARPEDAVLVAEVGTSSVGEIAPLADMLAPDVSIVTLIGCGHLAGLGDIASVAAEKYALVEALGTSGLALIRAGSPPARRCTGRLETFGFELQADHRITSRGPGWMKFESRRWAVGLPGEHGAVNSLAAILAARAVGIPEQAIADGLAAAEPSPHRMRSCMVGDVRVIDDTWNANPESMAAVLAAVPELDLHARRLVLVLGDMLELGESATEHHRMVAPLLEQLAEQVTLHQLVLVGQEMEALADELSGRLTAIPVTYEPKSDEACMARVTAQLRRGDTVLLKASRGIGLERILTHLESGALAS